MTIDYQYCDMIYDQYDLIELQCLDNRLQLAV